MHSFVFLCKIVTTGKAFVKKKIAPMHVINDKSLEEIDLTKLAGCLFCADDKSEFLRKGEHYRLLAHLSTWFKGVNIIDIGTHRGASALALSYNESNTVISFDVVNKMQSHQMPRVTRKIANVFNTKTFMENKDLILNSPLIFLDIDPHDGKLEFEFYEILQMCNYKGLLIVDDIWQFKNMRDHCWFQIPSARKVDVTPFGHTSGTGIINFGVDEIKTDWPKRVSQSQNPNDNWTVVTAYFDLTKQPDASDEIKARPQSYYLQHANMTMALDQNLVVFADSKSIEHLKLLRPKHLLSKTDFVVLEFKDVPLVQKWYEHIRTTRIRKRYNPDPRNTTSYYLFCMTRYYLLQQAIAKNVFGSSHFAWCNICIERMNGHLAGPFMDDIWQEFRQKFSTCYIDYQPKSLALNYEFYFQYGRCGMCSGFFTGNLHYMSVFCEKILAKFEQMASLGYGHADEQLFSLVFFDDPSIFEFYLGDYLEMTSNYGLIHFKPESPVVNLMSRLAQSGENQGLLKWACKRWLESLENKCFTAPPEMIEKVRNWIV
jgi:hypothetical protein